MSKIFLDSMDNKQLALYTFTTNARLLDIIESDLYSQSIRNLCKTSLMDRWELSKKITILNSITSDEEVA